MMDPIEVCKLHIAERLNEGLTHYEGCEQGHIVCAMQKLVELTEHLLQELLAADAREGEALASCQADVEQLRKTIERMVADGGDVATGEAPNGIG